MNSVIQIVADVLVATALLVGAVTFFPALTLGPLAEHLAARTIVR